MNEKARKALLRLYEAGEKSAHGIRSRKPALTASHLDEYRSLRVLSDKEDFDATMRWAKENGAISFSLERTGNGRDDFIERVDLVDLDALARLLGIKTVQEKLDQAEAVLAPFVQPFPVLVGVLDSWRSLRKVRAYGPEDATDWADAARIVQAMREESPKNEDRPIREVSAAMFKDSKRIEKLYGPVDVLLTGDIKGEIREPAEVWREIGLFREEQPVRMAGKVIIRRSRGTSVLDAPYAAFNADAVFTVEGSPEMVLTIENLTTFHSEAKKWHDRNILLIYTAGMPSPSWRAMYVRLLSSLPQGVPVCHWGDIDEGGFRIASVLARDAISVGHVLKPWKMSPDDVPEDRRCKATPSTLEKIRIYASRAGWPSLGDEIEKAGFTVEQEGL